MKKQVFFLFISVLLYQNSFSQIIGTTKDANGQPLPYVNIYIENSYTGTTSNEKGYFELNIKEPKNYTLVFQSLGYKTVKRNIDINQFPYEIHIVLEEENISLNEVVINSKENPANQIIRQAIAHRKKNLGRIKNFKADFYSKGLIKVKNVPEKILGQKIDNLDGIVLDSTRSGVIYLSETLSKIEYLFPNKLKEHIIASKVSGDDKGFSFNTAESVNYNFYNNTIELGHQIISPISNYAFNYYNYKLEGTFLDDRGNLINKIKVIPKRDKDPVFSGHIYLVEDQWTFYAIELSITGEQAKILPANIITITQNFSYSESDDIWSIFSQQIDFDFNFFGIKGDGKFTAVYNNYIYNFPIEKSTFGKQIIFFEKNANEKDSLYWEQFRPIPLTTEEIKDYAMKDSIQTIRASKPYLDSLDHANNSFRFGDILSGYSYQNSFEHWRFNISSPLSQIKFNTVQGFNSGIDFNFTKNYDEYKRYLTLKATTNYGFSDDRLRGSISGSFKFNNISRPYLSISAGVKTEQFNPNLHELEKLNTEFSLFAEENYLKIYDKSFINVSYSQELFNGFSLYTHLGYERRKPLFNTTDQVWFPKSNKTYTSNNPLDPTAYNIASFEAHNILKLNLTATIKFGQTYMSYPGSKFNIYNNKFPTLYLGYEKGFGATISNYDFDQIKARITQNFDIDNKGFFSYNIKAGTFFNADDIAFVDYQHFNGNQTHISTSGNYIDVFNNLPYYALSTNKSYIELHAEHDFNGYILGKIPLLNKLNFNLILGAHNLSTQDNKPYQEYSIGLDNIGWGKFRFFRIDYLRSYQNGFVNDAFVFGLKFF